MRAQVKKGIYLSPNKLKEQYKQKWDLYVRWCDTESLEVYNMDNLRLFDRSIIYESEETGTVIIDRDVIIQEDGLVYDERSDSNPREYFEEVKIWK